ncbi:Origin recognition complex subunit 2 [Kluyveromyces marxianus]|nr:Origin recognition complex subunit 2 [Kluyveromyces marxianus]KAG0684874.1 Origin recognition complex subunit 2 [Kluyveromyces marxianus]
MTQEDLNDDGIVDHQDIFLSPSKLKSLSPIRSKSPKKSPRRSLILESIKVEESVKGSTIKDEDVEDDDEQEEDKYEDAVSETPRRRRKKVKVEEEDAPYQLGDDPSVEATIKSEDSPVKKSPRRKLVFSNDQSSAASSPNKRSTNGTAQKINKLLLDDDVLPEENIQDYKNIKLNLNPEFKPTPVPKDGEHSIAHDEQSQIYFFDGFEGYIDQTKILKSEKKSKNSMSAAPSITRDEYNILSQLSNDIFHKTSIHAIQSSHKKLFQQFTFELLQGFTLLFYGIGSKKNFLNPSHLISFRPKLPCYKTLTFRKMTNVCPIDLQMDRLLKYFSKRPPTVKMILLIHNLDGPSFRKEQFQTRMSMLAQIKQICIIASVDHIQAPFLWDHFKAQSFNFVYHDITNFEPYIVETIQSSHAVNLANNESTLFNATAAKYVLESLTDNSKRMYKILLQLLMEKQSKSKNKKTGGKTTTGTEFAKLFEACTEQFVVSSEMSLRTMLSEFVDHKMAFITKNKMGKEIVDVKYSYGDMEKLVKEIDAMVQ